MVGVLAMLFSAACQPPAPTPPPLTAVDVVTRAALAARSLETVHVVLTIQGLAAPIATGLGLTRAEGDIRRPSDAALKLKLAFGTSSLETEMRAINGRTYIRSPLGARYEEVPGAGRMALLDPETGLGNVISKVIEPKLAGEDVENGIKMHLVESRVPPELLAEIIGGRPTGEPVPVSAAVREADWLLRRLTITGAALVGDQPDVVRTIELSAWNQPVVIPTPPGV